MVLEFTANLVSLSAGSHPLKLEAVSREPQDDYIVLMVFL